MAGRLARRLVFGVLLLAQALPIASAALAASPVPIIEAGREGEVLALFSPLRLEGEVGPGWRLQNVAVRATEIAAELSGPGGARSFVVFGHRGEGSRGELTPSFVVSRDASSAGGAATAAADRLVSAVRANDRGNFWRATAKPVEAAPAAEPAGRGAIAAPIGVALVTVLGMWLASRRTKPVALP